MVGKHASKLGLLNAQGIRTALLSEIGADAEADIVVDATGSDSGLTTALRLVRPRGTVVLKTTVAGSQTLALAPVVVDEVTVVGSRCGPFDQALALLASGGVSVAPLISSRFELSRGPEALAAAASQLMVLIDVHD